MANRDIALFSRFVFLSFTTSQFSQEQMHAMEKFREIRKRGCSHLTLDIIKLRPQFEQGFQRTYYDVTDQLAKQYADSIEGRIMGNWAIIMAAFKTLENYLKLPFEYAEVYRECCALMEVQNTMSRENNEIANFWKIVSILVNKGVLYEDNDFHIKYMDSIKLKVGKETTTRPLNRVMPVLIIRGTVFDEYKEYCTAHSENYLSAPSLKQYLKAAKDYIGIRAKEAFPLIRNGEPLFVSKPDKKTGELKKERARYVGEAMCFDYQLACELYEFSLASTNIIEESADDDEE